MVNRSMVFDPWQAELIGEASPEIVSAQYFETENASSNTIPRPLSGDHNSDITSDVYQLKPIDVMVAVLSGPIVGPIYLTDPYYPNISPFINLPITNSLKNQFIKRRHRVM
jgi:hypothetical protein